EGADRGGIEMQRAIADGAARAVVDVEHRREREVDAVRGELGARNVAERAGGAAREVAVPVPEPAELAHRRQRGESGAKALHAPALVIHADGQRRLACALDRSEEHTSELQ